MSAVADTDTDHRLWQQAGLWIGTSLRLSVQLHFYMTDRVPPPLPAYFPTENVKCSDSWALRFRKCVCSVCCDFALALRLD